MPRYSEEDLVAMMIRYEVKGLDLKNSKDVGYLLRIAKEHELPGYKDKRKSLVDPVLQTKSNGIIEPEMQSVKEDLHSTKRPVKHVVDFNGLPIHIEIEKGETKSGVGPDGKSWEHEYQVPYGEILKTEGRDGDPVDIYLGPDTSSTRVFIVHQLDPQGNFDEDKVFLGFNYAGEVEKAYKEHGPSWGFGSMEIMDLNSFKTGYLAANRRGGHLKNTLKEQKNSDGICPECCGEMKELHGDVLPGMQCSACGLKLQGDQALEHKNASGMICQICGNQKPDVRLRKAIDIDGEIMDGYTCQECFDESGLILRNASPASKAELQEQLALAEIPWKKASAALDDAKKSGNRAEIDAAQKVAETHARVILGLEKLIREHRESMTNADSGIAPSAMGFQQDMKTTTAKAEEQNARTEDLSKIAELRKKIMSAPKDERLKLEAEVDALEKKNAQEWWCKMHGKVITAKDREPGGDHEKCQTELVEKKHTSKNNVTNTRPFDAKKLAEKRPCPKCSNEVVLVDTTTGLCKDCFDKDPGIEQSIKRSDEAIGGTSNTSEKENTNMSLTCEECDLEVTKKISDGVRGQTRGGTGLRFPDNWWSDDAGFSLCPKHSHLRNTSNTSDRAHTPIVSEKQAGFFGAELGRLRRGEATESGMSEAELSRHLKEWGGNSMKNSNPKKIWEETSPENRRLWLNQTGSVGGSNWKWDDLDPSAQDAIGWLIKERFNENEKIENSAQSSYWDSTTPQKRYDLLSAYNLDTKWTGVFWDRLPSDIQSKLEKIITLPNVENAEPAKDKIGKYGYIGLYKGKQYEVYADSSYGAQKKLAAQLGAKRESDVDVWLVEKGGEQVTTFLDNAEMIKTFEQAKEHLKTCMSEYDFGKPCKNCAIAQRIVDSSPKNSIDQADIPFLDHSKEDLGNKMYGSGN
jgi:inorganic pyrophosphatase